MTLMVKKNVFIFSKREKKKQKWEAEGTEEKESSINLTKVLERLGLPEKTEV